MILMHENVAINFYISLNVGVQNVKAVITTALKNITHKSVKRLPCRTTLCDMMVKSLTVAHAGSVR